MPWAFVVLLSIWLIMMIPIVQTVLAFVIAFVTLPIVGPIVQITEPIIKILMGRGMSGGVAAIAASSVIVAPVVAFCIYRCTRRDLTERQRWRSINGLILAVGVPATVAFAWLLLPDKFG